VLPQGQNTVRDSAPFPFTLPSRELIPPDHSPLSSSRAQPPATRSAGRHRGGDDHGREGLLDVYGRQRSQRKLAATGPAPACTLRLARQRWPLGSLGQLFSSAVDVGSVPALDGPLTKPGGNLLGWPCALYYNCTGTSTSLSRLHPSASTTLRFFPPFNVISFGVT
jgi:hypothetical protein